MYQSGILLSSKLNGLSFFEALQDAFVVLKLFLIVPLERNSGHACICCLDLHINPRVDLRYWRLKLRLQRFGLLFRGSWFLGACFSFDRFDLEVVPFFLFGLFCQLPGVQDNILLLLIHMVLSVVLELLDKFLKSSRATIQYCLPSFNDLVGDGIGI